MSKLKWTFKACKEEALKYDSRVKFSKSNGSAYNSARKNEWLNDICSHMEFIQLPKDFWDKSKCLEEALKYRTREEFKKSSSKAYHFAVRREWYDDICLHMDEIRKPNGYWSFERCKDEALIYNNTTDFINGSVSAYNSCRKNKWLKELTTHFKIKGTLKKRFIYAYEFEDNHVYVGLTYNVVKRQVGHSISGSVFKHIENTKSKFNFIQITESPVDIEKAKELEDYYLNKYIKEGWIPLNKIKTGGVGGNIHKWTYDNVKNEALKYKNRGEFSRNSASSYIAALKNKWLEDVCSHMESKKRCNYWTIDRCIELSVGCSTISEYRNKSESAYMVVLKNKWKSLVFKNFEVLRLSEKYWTYEKCVEVIKKFKNYKELRKVHYGAYKTINKNKWQESINIYFKKDEV
mgnify:CR=1 FL=1